MVAKPPLLEREPLNMAKKIGLEEIIIYFQQTNAPVHQKKKK